MGVQLGHFCTFSLLLVVALISQNPHPSTAVEYIVGGKDYGWSIPLSNDFYSDWSSSHSFFVGDTLVFDFDQDLHNLNQVSRREYDSCSANQPYKVHQEAPAVVHLREHGVFYYMCSILYYCSLGQKLTVSVNTTSPALPPASPPFLQPQTQPI